MRMLTAGVCVLLGLGCASAPDLDTYRDEILALHNATIRAHLDGEPDVITRGMADGFLSVANGEVRVRSREEFEQGYRGYLSSTQYQEYRDLQEPMIGFSKDGSLAWLIARVRATGRRVAADGSAEPVEFTAAWMTLYERRDNGWARIADAFNLEAEE